MKTTIKYIITAISIFVLFIFIGYIYSLDNNIINKNSLSFESKEYDFKTEDIEYVLYNTYSDISTISKEYIIKLNKLWNEYKENIDQSINPEYSFKNSEFINILKEYLGKRESLEVPLEELNFLINQRCFEYKDKKCIINNIEYNIRVIGYYANLDVQANTDLAVENKWIFVQVWNDTYFNFYVIVDGGFNFFDNFSINEDLSEINIILINGATKEKIYIKYKILN